MIKDFDLYNARSLALDYAKGSLLSDTPLDVVMKRAETFYQFIMKGQKIAKRK